MAHARATARLFVGIAGLAPAAALGVVGVAIAARGGAASVLAGIFVLLLGVALGGMAAMMLRAPGAALWFLRQEQQAAHDEGENGRG